MIARPLAFLAAATFLPDAAFAAAYADVDPSPTKTRMRANSGDPPAPRFSLAFGVRPAEELYDMVADLDRPRKLAGGAPAVCDSLRARLAGHARATGDPSAAEIEDLAAPDTPDPWDSLPFEDVRNREGEP
jgi:hypothetical protein